MKEVIDLKEEAIVIDLKSGMGMKLLRIAPTRRGMVSLECLYKPAFTEELLWGNNMNADEVSRLIEALQNTLLIAKAIEELERALLTAKATE